jgi:16S rRNA (guanine527-N7)-methyltransferase
MVETSKLPALANVSRETLAKLELYEDLLKRWQKVKNLIAPSTLGQLWERHFADSAQLLQLAPDARIWADLGSGAGFPGLVLAILMREHEGRVVHLVESDHRKCAFLREAARETGAPAVVHNERIESVVERLQGIDIVTARALTALPRLLQLSLPLLEQGAKGLFLKGQDVASELTEDAIFSMVSLKFLPSVTSPTGRIVKVEMRHEE